jgi:hypothetical protein
MMYSGGYWNEGEDPEVISARIREQVRDATVMSPAEAGRQVGQAMTVTNSVILGSALVALIVASLAVANTMFTAVVERRREIGLRRVVGATRRQVIRQLVLEATFLNLAGSIGGLAGAAAARALNDHERLGVRTLVTPRLVLLGAVIPSVPRSRLAGMARRAPASHRLSVRVMLRRVLIALVACAAGCRAAPVGGGARPPRRRVAFANITVWEYDVDPRRATSRGGPASRRRTSRCAAALMARLGASVQTNARFDADAPHRRATYERL